MCLATPSKVIKINKNKATVQSGDHQHRVSLDLVKNVKVGDYLLIHNDLAINKLSKPEAEKIFRIIANHSKNLEVQPRF